MSSRDEINELRRVALADKRALCRGPSGYLHPPDIRPWRGRPPSTSNRFGRWMTGLRCLSRNALLWLQAAKPIGGNMPKPVVRAVSLPIPLQIAESGADSRPRFGEQTATAEGAFIQQTRASTQFRGRCCVATEEDSARRLPLRSARAAVTLRSLLACAHLALPRGRGSEQ